MPWSRLRVTRPSDTALHRHSTLDPANIQSAGSQEMRISHDGTMESLKNVRSASPSPLRNSIDPAGAANDASFGERPPSPPLPNARQQRFSILKFRHASDSQLSRTAKEQAQAAISPPPMPNGKHALLICIIFPLSATFTSQKLDDMMSYKSSCFVHIGCSKSRITPFGDDSFDSELADFDFM